MTERVLFSPVGSADPLTMLGDGPMLHIVRHYRPNVVVLLASPRMGALERADHRYTKAIAHLDSAIEVCVVDSRTTTVYRYDEFIPEFRERLCDLAEKFPDADIIVNTSSGTPAMKAALVAINAFGIPATTAVQVPTPKGDVNDAGSREALDNYDLESLEELNPDAEPGALNRCEEIASPNFATFLQRRNVKELINSYSYDAARVISNRAGLSDKTRDVIIGAHERLTLQLDVAVGRFRGTPFSIDPRRGRLKEAVSGLAVLCARKQWLDFARATTPIVDGVVNKEVRERCGLSERELNSRDYREFPKRFEMLSDESKQELRPLKTFHEKIRNDIAHGLAETSSHQIRDKTGLAPREFVALLAERTGADPKLYDKINAYVIAQIDGAPLHL